MCANKGNLNSLGAQRSHDTRRLLLLNAVYSIAVFHMPKRRVQEHATRIKSEVEVRVEDSSA